MLNQCSQAIAGIHQFWEHVQAEWPKCYVGPLFRIDGCCRRVENADLREFRRARYVCSPWVRSWVGSDLVLNSGRWAAGKRLGEDVGVDNRSSAARPARFLQDSGAPRLSPPVVAVDDGNAGVREEETRTVRESVDAVHVLDGN